jgi:hypothetical protein
MESEIPNKIPDWSFSNFSIEKIRKPYQISKK